MSDNTYTISDFSKVIIGMTYDEVIQLMGEPTSSLGEMSIIATYSLTGGGYIKLAFLVLGPLSDISIVDSTNRVFELKQSE